MAVEKIINLKVNDDIKETEGNVVSLKRQLREAQQDVQNLSDKFGATSAQAVEAAKKAAELKDRIGDAKNLTDAFNPDAKFKALTGALSGAAGAGAAFAGTLGIMGVESKDVEKALLKVQSAMAISQGLQAVGESIDSFKNLKTVIFGATVAKNADTVASEVNDASQKKNIISRGIQIAQTGVQTALTGALTAATWLFNYAMAANPIGAIVAAITLLIAGGYALVNMFMASSAATKKAELANKALTKEIEHNKKAQEKANDAFDAAREHQLGMAKATGKSAEYIRKLTLELAKQEVQQKLTNYETNRTIALEASRIGMKAGATEAEKKTAAEAIKISNESVKAVNEAVLKRRKVESENQIARAQEQTDAAKTAGENQKKSGNDAVKTAEDNAKKLRQAELEGIITNEKLSFEEKRNLINKNNKFTLDEKTEFLGKVEDQEKAHKKKLQDLGKKIDDDIQNLKDTTAQQKLETQKLRDQKEIDALAKTEEEKAELKLKLDEKYKILQDELTAKANEDKLKKDNEQFLRLQELTLQKEDFEKLKLRQKYDAEYLAAEGNVELQKSLKTKLESDIKLIDDKSLEDKKLREQQLLDAKLAFAQQGLSLVAEIAGKGSKIGKAVAVAQATISGIEGVQNAYTTAQKSPITLGFPAYPYVQAGLAGVFSALQIRKILSTDSSGGGGGASGGAGGVAAAAAPSFNIVGQNPNNQLAQTIAGQQQQPIQAFVVSGNVSTAQSLDRNRIDTATFN